MDVAETIEEIAARRSEDVIARMAERMDRQEQKLAELMQALQLATASVTMLMQQLLAAALSRPPGDLPPPELDAACAAAAAAGGAQRIPLDVHGVTVIEYVQPGDDPATVWARVRAAVTDPEAAWRN